MENNREVWTQAQREDQLRDVTIGQLHVLGGPIELVEYDPAWPERFDREKERITGALGARAQIIEHVGSTAVAGLVAKPIIDILLVVADSADEDGYLAALESSGFILRIREPEWHEHRMFKSSDSMVNVHVFSVGCPEVERMIVFRDRLRGDPIDRERYARSKRELARKEWKYVQNYADAKASVVEEIIARARAAG